ncbi:MAG: asparagine synthase-related protein [Steroidobacteraceae bacterium]
MASQLRIIGGKSAVARNSATQGNWSNLHAAEDLLVQCLGKPLSWTSLDGSRNFLLGDLVGFRRADGSIADASSWAAETQRFDSPRGIDTVEGRFAYVRVDSSGQCEVRTDRFGSVDLYYQLFDGGVEIATRLDLLPVGKTGAAPSPLGYAHALTVYGARPAKMDTLYAGVSRVGVGQSVMVQAGKPKVVQHPFVAASAGAYGERENNEYADALLETIRAQGSPYGNVVYLSSGWDSTSILACLVHLFGARKVRAVIGRMRYSERSGVINQFELDRAKAMAEFYGVKLEICEFDYRHDAADTVAAVKPLYRAHHFASATGLNHWRLASHVAKTTTGDETVFAGEISDGAHNLGFSQYVTIFHPSMEFREYSDKMASYLFGPTFLSLLLSGHHDKDPIWNLFKSRAGNTAFDAPAKDPADRTLQLLSSFFLRGTRMPFCSLSNGSFLTEAGRGAYQDQMQSRYLEQAGREATPENLYSWYLRLYNSFHWQGSTVATLATTAAEHGLKCALPFYDGRIQDFLSTMPESWGRGLDLKPTKYPLKWTLQNRVKYPMHLQVGPHSYLYDVEPDFSHAAELLFDSSLGTAFKNALRSRPYESWFAGEYFDRPYIERIVKRYLSNEEFRGAEMNDVLLLGLLATAGRLGEA